MKTLRSSNIPAWAPRDGVAYKIAYSSVRLAYANPILYSLMSILDIGKLR